MTWRMKSCATRWACLAHLRLIHREAWIPSATSPVSLHEMHVELHETVSPFAYPHVHVNAAELMTEWDWTDS